MKRSVFVDFNGFGNIEDDNFSFLDLCGYGTIASLSNQMIRLEVGMELVLFAPGDIEVDAVIEFYTEIKDKFNLGGKWFGKFEKGAIRASKTAEDQYDYSHFCFNCRLELSEFLDEIGRQYSENCPNCNTPIMFPLLPPN